MNPDDTGPTRNPLTPNVAALAGLKAGLGLTSGMADMFPGVFGTEPDTTGSITPDPVRRTVSKTRSKTSKAELKKRARQSRQDRKR